MVNNTIQQQLVAELGMLTLANITFIHTSVMCVEPFRGLDDFCR